MYTTWKKVFVIGLTVWTAIILYGCSEHFADQGVPGQEDVAVAPSELIPSQRGERFRAIGQFRGALTCTASLVSDSAEPPAQAPAMVVTAGHCVRRFGTNDVIVDQPAGEGWRFIPAYFHDSPDEHHAYGVDRVLYATMKGTDVAVLRLHATYGELRGRGIRPLHLIGPEPGGGIPVELVHIPVEGVAPEEAFLRLSRCITGGVSADLFEGDNPWLWRNTMMLRCADVAGGSSGAPALREGTTDVVGLVGTTVNASLNGCGENRPCELTDHQPFVREGASYAVSITGLLKAFRPDGSWDPSGLDDGGQVVLDRTVAWITQSKVGSPGMAKPAVWGVRVGGDMPWIRYKTGTAASLNCSESDEYGPAVPAATQPLLNHPVGDTEGLYGVCVIGSKERDTGWQPLAHAAVLLRWLDDRPPDHLPLLYLYLETENSWLVYGKPNPYDILAIEIKYGPRDTTDCGLDVGYASPSSFWETLAKSAAPWRFCVKGFNAAGIPSTPVQRDFDVPHR